MAHPLPECAKAPNLRRKSARQKHASGRIVTPSETLLPALVSLASAVAFGGSGVAAKRGLAHVDPLAGTVVAVGTCLVAYLLLAPLWMRVDDWFTAGFWVFALMGVIQPSLSMYLANEAYKRGGATIAATFAATAPLFAAALAIAFLGERLTTLIAAGTLLTVLGIVTLSWVPRGSHRQRMVAAALAFATATAAIRGLSHAVGKVGMELLPNALMAGFCSFAVSFAILAAVYRLRRGRWSTRIPPAGLGYFCLTGLCIACGLGLLFTGLMLGEVVIVSPIVGTYPVFTLLASVALGDERFTGKVLAGVGLVVVGVAFVSASGG